MRTAKAGALNVSVIGLGCWQFGSREWGYGDRYAHGVAGDILHRALDLGVTLIDTAEAYGFGRSERIVGKALGTRRDEAVVATKLFPILPVPPIVVNRGKGSARRLAIDTIDLYQVHQPNPVVSDRFIMPGMRRLLDASTIANVGVSNYSLQRWKAADDALGAPVVSNQVEYSLVQRKPERDLLKWAQDNDRLIIAYSPLAQGLLGGRYGPDNRPGGVRAMNPHFTPESLGRSAQLLAALRQIAKSHDATPAQVSLAWLVHHPNVVAIPGASSVEQLEHNAAAADLELTEAEIQELDELSAAYRPTGMASVAKSLIRR